ncbi:hypothetical protein IWQ56_004472, partial [Coemansia nantahalensis]
TEILVNALRNNPPKNAREALDRIAEARSIRSGVYLAAIVRALADPADHGPPDRLQDHFATLSLCESLVGAIATVETHDGDPGINPGLVAWLCRHAMARQWPVDPAVLQEAAVYLARASYRGSELDAVATTEAGDTAAGLALQAALEALQWLEDRSALAARSPVYFHIVAALCAHDRVADAERLFALAGAASAKHMGAAAAAMMSMYYRRGDAARAEAVFAAHAAEWARVWEAMATLPVLPDRPSLEAEKWRLTHEEGAASTPQLLLADDLRRACSAASPPFFRRALELIRARRVDEAVGFLGDVRRAHHVALSEPQLDALVQALLAQSCTDQAYGLCMEFRRGEYPVGGAGTVAQRVVFGAAVSASTLAAVLAQLGAADDWSRVWSLAEAVPDAARRRECLACMQDLLAHALGGGDTRQALRCAQHIAAIGGRDSQALVALEDRWVEDALRRAAALGQPVAQLAAALQCADATALSAALLEWNGR